MVKKSPNSIGAHIFQRSLLLLFVFLLISSCASREVPIITMETLTYVDIGLRVSARLTAKRILTPSSPLPLLHLARLTCYDLIFPYRFRHEKSGGQHNGNWDFFQLNEFHILNRPRTAFFFSVLTAKYTRTSCTIRKILFVASNYLKRNSEMCTSETLHDE